MLHTMTNSRTIAKLTGYSLLLMAAIAGFSFGYAFPQIYEPAQIDSAQSKLLANLQLYNFMLLGIVLVILLDLMVSWTLYLYFKNDNSKLALLSGFLRLIYTLIFSIATYHLAKNITQLDYGNTTIVENFKSFQFIWSLGLIVFGFHLVIVGLLMKLHKFIPGILWYLTIFAGASYILVHGLKATQPQSTALINTLNNILALPMALGELGLAIWLLIKGGKTKQT
jgi:hypothetical protein